MSICEILLELEADIEKRIRFVNNRLAEQGLNLVEIQINVPRIEITKIGSAYPQYVIGQPVCTTKVSRSYSGAEK